MQYKCVHAGDVLSVQTARLINACSEIIHQTLHVLEKRGDTVWLVSAPVDTEHNSSEFFFWLKLCLCHSSFFFLNLIWFLKELPQQIFQLFPLTAGKCPP